MQRVQRNLYIYYRKACGEHCDIQIVIDYKMKLTIYSISSCTLCHWNGYMPCTSPPWPCILLTLDLPDIDFRVLFWIFLQTGFSKLSGSVNLQKQGTARFWMSNSPIKALTLWMLATFWTRSPSKIKSLRTFNTRSCHAFPIAILVLLLPKSSITKQVYSNSTFKVFHMIPHLATARIQNFFTLHVAI